MKRAYQLKVPLLEPQIIQSITSIINVAAKVNNIFYVTSTVGRIHVHISATYIYFVITF